VVTHAKLDKNFRRNNIGAPHFDAAQQLLVLLYTPYDSKTGTTRNYVSVDARTGLTTKTVKVNTTLVPGSWITSLGADAYDAEKRVMYQFWDASDGPLGYADGYALSSVNMDSGTTRTTLTQLPLVGNYIGCPLFHGGKIYGVDGSGFLVTVDVEGGASARLSTVALLNNMAVWYPGWYTCCVLVDPPWP
jgi:hypothetical protein